MISTAVVNVIHS